MIPYRARPSAGFLLLVSVVASSAAFLAWGLSTPPLDEAWRLQLELEVGERGRLSGGDRKLLERTLARHPALADAWLDGASAGIISDHRGGLVEGGAAYVLRRGAEPATLDLTLAPGQELPVVVRARAGRSSAEASVDPGGTWSWALPDEGPFPQLVEVLIGEQAEKKKPGRDKKRRSAPAAILRLREAK